MSTNIQIKIGDSYSRVVSITRSKTAVNLTGYNAKLFIKNADDTIKEILCTIPTPTSGQVSLSITREDSLEFNPGRNSFELKIFKQDLSDVKTVLDGDIVFYEVLQKDLT